MFIYKFIFFLQYYFYFSNRNCRLCHTFYSNKVVVCYEVNMLIRNKVQMLHFTLYYGLQYDLSSLSKIEKRIYAFFMSCAIL